VTLEFGVIALLIPNKDLNKLRKRRHTFIRHSYSIYTCCKRYGQPQVGQWPGRVRTVTRLSSNSGRIGQLQSRPDPVWQARSTTELASNLGEKEVPILLTHYSFSEYNWVEFELTLNIYISVTTNLTTLIYSTWFLLSQHELPHGHSEAGGKTIEKVRSTTSWPVTRARHGQSHDFPVARGTPRKGTVNHRLASNPEMARSVTRLSSSRTTDTQLDYRGFQGLISP
jgi:hypothetical protein